MVRKHQVVMLSTEKASELWSSKHNRLYYKQGNFNDPEDCTDYHLYILSHEEIEEGNWFLSLYGSYPLHNVKGGFDMYPCDLSEFKKIIATTDPKLDVPQISQDFIEAYVKAHNEGNAIMEVSLEYEEATNQVPKGKTISWLKLREDNTVIIHKTKEKKYTQDEVIKLLQDCTQYVIFNITSDHTKRIEMLKLQKDWIRDNYSE